MTYRACCLDMHSVFWFPASDQHNKRHNFKYGVQSSQSAKSSIVWKRDHIAVLDYKYVGTQSETTELRLRGLLPRTSFISISLCKELVSFSGTSPSPGNCLVGRLVLLHV